MLTADPMFKSPEVLYITMALIGLLVICVFVIAGLVLVVAKRRRDAGTQRCVSLYLTLLQQTGSVSLRLNMFRMCTASEHIRATECHLPCGSTR